jgi:NAD(P)-dependent dehydrogenase (short-subunit alcohol dehydrogenase family)
MSATSPIILILGAGPRIGTSVAKAFAAKGYKVALTSRKASEAKNNANEIHIQIDLADPTTVVNAFSKVKATFGVPSVVVYNGGDHCRFKILP